MHFPRTARIIPRTLSPFLILSLIAKTDVSSLAGARRSARDRQHESAGVGPRSFSLARSYRSSRSHVQYGENVTPPLLCCSSRAHTHIPCISTLRARAEKLFNECAARALRIPMRCACVRTKAQLRAQDARYTHIHRCRVNPRRFGRPTRRQL